MAVEFVNVYRESLPDARLIGKRYPLAQREAAFYTAAWEEWLRKDWFAPLRPLALPQREGDAYVGHMHYREGQLEYWIGMLALPDARVPLGYGHLEFPAGDVGVVQLRGPDSWELFSHHNDCVRMLREHGMKVPHYPSCMERYSQARFVQPGGHDDVTLDYCVFLEQ